MKKFGAVLLFALIALVLAACQQGPKTSFSATLNGANEVQVPPVTTEGTGTATLTLNGDAFTLTGSYENLSGPAIAAHIHGPATKSENAGVVVPLTFTEGSTAGSGTLSGSGTFTADQLADLRSGLYYVNVHTEANPEGEIRGQLE